MSDAITRLNAALEDRYAIDRELGEGGMAHWRLIHPTRRERSRFTFGAFPSPASGRRSPRVEGPPRLVTGREHRLLLDPGGRPPKLHGRPPPARADPDGPVEGPPLRGTIPFHRHPISIPGNRVIVGQMNVAAQQADSAPERFIVVTNWFEELRQRLVPN